MSDPKEPGGASNEPKPIKHSPPNPVRPPEARSHDRGGESIVGGAAPKRPRSGDEKKD